jgi:hypothetical protein
LAEIAGAAVLLDWMKSLSELRIFGVGLPYYPAMGERSESLGGVARA